MWQDRRGIALKVLIAGGGIGGMAAAGFLMQAGHEVIIVEQAAAVGEIGAGIQISPNAARVLRHLGAFEAVEAVAARPTSYRFRLFDTGEVLQSIAFGPAYEARHGLPYLTVHRADLFAALLDVVMVLDPTCLRLGAKVNGYTTDSTGVTLHTAAGDLRGDVLIGADGLKSQIRTSMLGQTPARFTGQAAWRISVPARALADKQVHDDVDIWVGPGRHAVTYPMRRGEIVNMVAGVRCAQWEEESWTVARPWEELLADFPGWHPDIQRLVEKADRDACYRWALHDRDPIETWTDGNVALLGDAAHPTLPYLAQGAAMALEDAAIITRALTEVTHPAAALGRYRDARFDRTSRVVRESRSNAALFQMPDTEALRAAFAKRDMSAERNAWLFSYDPLTASI
jgi:salicylate hydroxylase